MPVGEDGRINGLYHLTNKRDVLKYYLSLTKIPIEKSCESVSRILFSIREKESPAESSFRFR